MSSYALAAAGESHQTQIKSIFYKFSSSGKLQAQMENQEHFYEFSPSSKLQA